MQKCWPYRLSGTIWIWLASMLVALVLEAAEAPQSTEANRDAEYRRLVLGTWEDDYQGKRTMTLRQDGTGTMEVTLSGLKATLYASHLRFDMVWSIEHGRLKKQTIGGEPSGRVKLILKMMGDRVDEPILALTKQRLQLLDQDGKTKYEWRRVTIAQGQKKAP